MTANLTSIEAEQTFNPMVTEIFSSNGSWKGFKIKRFIRPSMYVPERTLSNHTLQFNFGKLRYLYRGGQKENGLPVYLIRETLLSFCHKGKRKNFNGTEIIMPWRLNSSQHSSTPCLKNKTSGFGKSIMFVIRFYKTLLLSFMKGRT